ncbi:MAG: HEAT repeat domain-containing protein [Anaerolineae bacterium]
MGDQSSVVSRADLEREQAAEEYQRAAEPLLAELAQIGFPVQTVGELYQGKLNYKAAIPVLLRWLPNIRNRYVQDDVVRALTVRWARPIAAPVLLRMFDQIDDPTGTGLKWTVANALSVVADDSVFDQIVALATDKTNGQSREMLTVTLGNMKNPYAVDVLISLLSDDEVAGHALIGLGKLKAQRARPLIESFLGHPKLWVRKEAQKALGKLDR